jgi:hypothetical protein
MSQRELRGRTVEIVSEEMDLGSREKSPDFEELPIEIERVRPEVDEVNNEAEGSQRVVVAEVPDLQTGSLGKDQTDKGDGTPKSEMTILINMMQQQFQELKDGQRKSDQRVQGLEEVIKQAQEEIIAGFKQAQEKTDQQFEELKNGQKQAQENSDQKFQEVKNGQKQAQEKTDQKIGELKEGLQKDINQVLIECRKSREQLKQELSEKLSAEIEKITIDINKVKGEVRKCENRLEKEMIGVKNQFEKEREEQEAKVEQLAAYQEAEISSVKHQMQVNKAEITNAVAAVKGDVDAIQERLSKVEGTSHELVHLNSSVQQMQQKFEENVSEASRQLREQDRPIEQQANSEPPSVQKEFKQIEQEVGIVVGRGTEENHESSLGLVEKATVCVVEILRSSSDKERGSEFTKEADVTCYSADIHEVPEQEKHSNVDPKDLQGKDSGILIEQSKTINVVQTPQLFEGLDKFSPSFTERTDKCYLLEYQCQAKSGQFSRLFSRQVPFACRPAVKFQFQNKRKGRRFKKICQKPPDEPVKEDLPSTILKAHAKVRKKAERGKRQKRKVKFKGQIGGQVLAKHQPVANARKANTKRKQKVESRKFRRRKVKFKWQCQIRDWVSQKSTSLGC